MESWALALLVIAALLISFYIIKVVVQLWARQKYKAMKLHPKSHCDIDTFVNQNHNVPNPVNAVKCVLSHQIQIGSKFAGAKADVETAIPLEFYESSHVSGLYVSQRCRRRDTDTTDTTDNSKGTKRKQTTTTTTTPVTTYDWNELLTKGSSSTTTTTTTNPSLPIVVCTIRMGFGHHRLAYSVSSWAMSTGRPTIFHDLLSIDSRK